MHNLSKLKQFNNNPTINTHNKPHFHFSAIYIQIFEDSRGPKKGIRHICKSIKSNGQHLIPKYSK